VDVYIITSEAEGAVRENITRKQDQCDQMIKEMVVHTKDILSKEVRATARMAEIYDPKIDMKIPYWLKEEAA